MRQNTVRPSPYNVRQEHRCFKLADETNTIFFKQMPKAFKLCFSDCKHFTTVYTSQVSVKCYEAYATVSDGDELLLYKNK